VHPDGYKGDVMRLRAPTSRRSRRRP
jgi:hypothetical protein